MLTPDNYTMSNYEDIEDTRQLNELSNEELVLKQKEGKPEGARYCFLSNLNDNDWANGLGELIEELNKNIENNKDIKVIQATLQALQDTILYDNVAETKDVINDFIKLRSLALQSGKYRENSYKQQISIILLLDALARHYIKYSFGDNFDDESECLHLSHMLANVIIIRYQINTYYNKEVLL